MRDLHRTRQSNLTMFGKPAVSKQYKFLRTNGLGSQADTMASSRQPSYNQSHHYSHNSSYNYSQIRSSNQEPQGLKKYPMKSGSFNSDGQQLREKQREKERDRQKQKQKQRERERERERERQRVYSNTPMYNMPLKFSNQQPIFQNNYMSLNGNNQSLSNKPNIQDIRPNKYSLNQQVEIIGKNMFNLHYVIGKGGFGKVWKVDSKKSKKQYAMKEMFKTKIIQKKSIESVMNQRTLLSRLKHPFIVNMTYAFQDKENLYLIMDFLNGGDLRYHIGIRRRFSQNQTKFFIACLVLALNYLHSNNILHRDIKPQNLVMESNGYIRITDFGVSKQWKEENAHNTSGTPGYMAPQVMCHKNHSYAADYFAVGVLGYEFMLGRRPYLGKSRKQIRDQILSKQASIKYEQIPKGWSVEAADFINRMLIRNPANRLGALGFDDVRKHPWLKNVDWNKLLRKQIKSPYVPVNYEQFSHQISEDTISDNPEENALLLRDPDVQALFQGYQFPEIKEQPKYEVKPQIQKPLYQQQSNHSSNQTSQYTIIQPNQPQSQSSSPSPLSFRSDYKITSSSQIPSYRQVQNQSNYKHF